MKHFTAFATTLLLWLCAITAWADGVVVADTYTAASDITEGYYLIKTRFKGANYFVYHKTTNNASRPFQMKAEASVDKTTLGSNLQYVWYITKNANGLLVIQNASTGAFFPANNGNGGDFNHSTAITNAAIYEAKTFTSYTNSLEGGVYLRETNYGTNYNVHANKANNQDPDLSYWENGEPSETSSLVQFTFYKLTLPDGTTTQATPAYGAQIKHQYGDEVISSSWSVGLKATQIQPTTNKSYYYTANASNLTYGDAATTADMSLTYTMGNTPITLSTPDNPTYYRFQLRNQKGDSYCMVYQDDNNVKTASSTYNKTNYDLLRDAHWVVVESGMGVKLYNAAAKKYVTVSGADKKATMTDQGTTFYMQTTTYTGADFSLQYTGNSYLGDHKSNYLGTWTYSTAQNNDGSGFKAIAVDDTDLTTATALVENILPKALSGQTNNDNALTMNTAEGAEKGKALLERYNSSETKTWNLLDEIAFSTEFNISAQPDLNAYYRIRNVNSGLANRFLSSENIVVGTDGSLNTAYNKETGMDRKITRKSDSDNFGSQLWKFTKNNDGTFTLRNANTDREMGEATTTSIEMPINIGAGNGHYKFMPYTEGIFDNYDANSMFVMYDVNGNQVGANGDNYVAQNNNQYTDKSNYWQIIKVTKVPVMISTTAGWASVAYPFAVQVPSDVKAYIAATAEDDILTLQEITDGIIPANTGALLTKDGGGLVNLTITTTSTTYADNKLTASTAERSGFTAKDTYVLAAKSGKVGLYPSTLTIVPSNKAYLLKTNITTTASGEAQMMNFVVDGTVTGIIDAAQSNINKANDTYYDLNGRRVLYPTHGIYVKGNGQKVFIK